MDQQREPLRHGSGERVKKRGQQRSIGVLEADPLVGEWTLEHGELVSKS